MEAKINTLKFIASDFKEISRVTTDVCITHNATFINLHITKVPSSTAGLVGYACLFRYISYLE